MHLVAKVTAVYLYKELWSLTTEIWTVRKLRVFENDIFEKITGFDKHMF